MFDEFDQYEPTKETTMDKLINQLENIEANAMIFAELCKPQRTHHEQYKMIVTAVDVAIALAHQAQQETLPDDDEELEY